MLLWSLEAIGQHIQSYDTLCSEEAKISTLWYGASYPPLANRSARRRVVGESPTSRSTMSPCPSDGDVVGGLPDNVHHCPPMSSFARSR
jgi:hypothetical protein